jgi:Nuclease-related domain
MAWPRLRNRRSQASQSSDHNGAAVEPASQDSARAPAAWTRPAWPGGSGAATSSPAPADATGTAPDASDVRFWSWGKPADPDPDDPADALPPDRPDYADGPDPEYRGATATASPDDRSWPGQAPVVTPVEDAGEQREGIGQHLGNLTHLSGDPRMRAWQRRAIIAIVVGVAFSIVFNWRYGLTLAVLAAIADTIYRSRTEFNGPEGVWLSVAQRRTVRQLARMERKGYRALHCVSIPGTDDQIDHLVIGPAGVYAIDSEAWDRRVPVRTSSHRQLWHGSANMKDRLEHSRWEAERASELLSDTVGSPVSVRPTMAVYGPKIPWHVATIRDVDVFSGPGLRKYLKGRARQVKKQRLSASEIERIEKAANVVFPYDSVS